jgi:DNA-binding transcriptional LysR family regulator
MHETNLRAVDLNLLLVLDALLAERSVTRAAGRLHLSQPAASHALDRLRGLFGDPLLERRGTGMALTAKAEALRPRLETLIHEVQRLVDLPPTPLAELTQTVRLSLADYPCAILLPPLWQRLQQLAPKLQLVCQSWREGARELERLQRGDTDIALSLFTEVPDDLCREELGLEHYVGVARNNHPLGARPGLAEFCRYPHVLVSAVGAQRSSYDAQLQSRGWQRRVGISVSSFLAVPSIVAASDALALVPASLARHWPPMADLLHFTPPVVPPPFPVHLGYHRRRATDVAVMAVVDCLKAICSDDLLAGRGDVAARAPRQRMRPSPRSRKLALK